MGTLDEDLAGTENDMEDPLGEERVTNAEEPREHRSLPLGASRLYVSLTKAEYSEDSTSARCSAEVDAIYPP